MSPGTSLESTVVLSARRPTPSPRCQLPLPPVSQHRFLPLLFADMAMYVVMDVCRGNMQAPPTSRWWLSGCVNLLHGSPATAVSSRGCRLAWWVLGGLKFRPESHAWMRREGEQSQGQCRASWLTLYSSSAVSVANPWSHLTAMRLTRVKCRWMRASGTAHTCALKRNVRLSLVLLTKANVPSFSCRRDWTAADVCA